MRWLRSAVSRFLLYTAVALLVAVAFGALYGVKLSTSYNTTVPSAEVGAAVAVVMPASSSGVATVNVEGASQVLYLSLGTNPIQILPEVRGLGLKITTMQGTTDLRAGVVIEVAGLQGNPIFVEQAFESVVKSASPSHGVYSVTQPVSSSSYLVVVAVPSNTSQTITFTLSYHVVGYSRLTNEGAFALSAALVVVAVVYDLMKGLRL
jgi:membrane protein implicated in regulation of membrane protease activity